MPTPFPGMDPYLEQRGLWQEVHTGLIVNIQAFLGQLLPPRYRVAIEQYTYLTPSPPNAEEKVAYPDVLVLSSIAAPPAPPHSPGGSPGGSLSTSIDVNPVVGELPMGRITTQRYLTVREVKNREIITVIEILSPANKSTPAIRQQYLYKRHEILHGPTNLVEIDLLRVGAPLPMTVLGQPNPVGLRRGYRIVVSRSEERPKADIYLFGIREAIPDFPIPLRPGEEEPILPLNQILHEIYKQGFYHLAIDYQQPPEPPLLDEDAEWVAKLLRQV